MSHSEIQLSKGKVAIVDRDDLERLSSHRWYALFRDGGWHAARTVKGGGTRRTVYMHHEVAGTTSMIDHRNRDGLDNRKRNLRRCTKAQNARNSFRNIHGKTSRFKGVSLNKKPWRANIMVSGKQIYLGTYSNERAAAIAYDRAAVKYFGEFAATNFNNRRRDV